MASNIQIIDNYLHKDDFKRMQHWFYNECMWRFSSSPTYHEDAIEEVRKQGLGEDVDDDYQFTCQFWTTSQGIITPNFQNVAPLIKKLSPAILLRVKSNLTPMRSRIIERPYHIDMDLPNLAQKTAVFNITTCDGYTRFEDGDIVPSVENRMIIFDGNMKHGGTTTTNKKARIVINVNYFPQTDKIMSIRNRRKDIEMNNNFQTLI